MDRSDIQQAVREKYGAIASAVANASVNTGCCGTTACGCGDPTSSTLYSGAQTRGLPADAVTASLGWGNPTALLANVEPWRIYKVDDARAFLTESGVDVDRLAPQVDGRFASAFVRARKPEAKSCCGPECCA